MENTINLICFPYAGGSSSIYSKWKHFADENIKVIPVELAGRGKRLKEPFYKNMAETIDDVFREISPLLDKQPYALFGHSMGSSIVFELSHKILQNKKNGPVHLFVSGRCPPIIHKEDKKIHQLPDNEFMTEILETGGTPAEVFENKELREIFLPILRADYKMIEDYNYIDKDIKLNCGISVFNGKEDKMTTYQKIRKWEEYTTGKTEVYEFEGGHFFIHNYGSEIMNIINKTLKELPVNY